MRKLALLLTAVTVVGTVAEAAPGSAAPRAAALQVASVSLQSARTAVTTSTGRKLQLELDAQGAPGASAGDDVSVSLSTAATTTVESHEWQFPVDGAAFEVDDTGAGTLNVPSDQLGPYGTVDLTITPVGSPTTQKCNGNPISQTQKVSLSGTLAFDTLSSGGHKWGSITRKTLTASLVSIYATNAGTACVDFNNLPCVVGLVWGANHGENLNFSGIDTGTKASLIASRTTSLTAPDGATRSDLVSATTKRLSIAQSGSGATLSIVALGNSTGRASIKAGKPQTDSVNCKVGKKKKIETTTTWSKPKYTNGKKPLVVHEQVFGSIKIANTSQCSLSTTRLS